MRLTAGHGPGDERRRPRPGHSDAVDLPRPASVPGPEPRIRAPGTSLQKPVGCGSIRLDAGGRGYLERPHSAPASRFGCGESKENAHTPAGALLNNRSGSLATTHNWVLRYADTVVTQQPGTAGRAALHGPDRLNGRVAFEEGAGLQAFPGNAVTSANAPGPALFGTYSAQPSLVDHDVTSAP